MSEFFSPRVSYDEFLNGDSVSKNLLLAFRFVSFYLLAADSIIGGLVLPATFLV